MAIKRPLTINTTTGDLERIGGGDTVKDSNSIDATNNTGSSIPIVTPVYQTGTADEVEECDASAVVTARCIGLTAEAIADASTGVVQTSGLISALTGEWDAVTGDIGGLVPGARYWLDTLSGELTQTPPSADGEVIAPIGTAKSTTEFVIDIDRLIVL